MMSGTVDLVRQPDSAAAPASAQTSMVLSRWTDTSFAVRAQMGAHEAENWASPNSESWQGWIEARSWNNRHGGCDLLEEVIECVEETKSP